LQQIIVTILFMVVKLAPTYPKKAILMKFRWLLNTSIFCTIIFFSSPLFATSTTDCPSGKEKLCKQITNLEEIYSQLPAQPDFNQRTLFGPTYALALGYAHLGNTEKAEEYYKSSLNISSSTIENRYNRTGILEQYMLQKQYGDAFTYLKKKDVHRSLCKSAIQVFSYQNRVDLIERFLKETTCSPSSLSNGAKHLNKDQIINLYIKVSDFYDHISGIKYKRDLKREINYLLEMIAKKSLDNDINPSLPELIEKRALTNNPDKTTIKKLISFYAAKNDIKALEIFTENKHKFKNATNIIPFYDLQHNPTELSLIIYNKIEDPNRKFKALRQLLRYVSKTTKIAQKKEFEHISDMCLNMTFAQCIADHLPKEKITEKMGLEIDAYTSNYNHLHNFEANNKTLEIEKYKVLTIYTNTNGNYAAGNDKKLISKPPLWGAHIWIAHKDDCDEYYREDIERIQNNVQDKGKYIGEKPYLAVQCLVTRNQHEDLVLKSNTNEYAWLTELIVRAYYNTFSQSYEQLLKETAYLKENTNKKISNAIITVLLSDLATV